MGNGGGYGRVRITCSGGDLSQTEIQYPVVSRHTPPCQTKFSKTRDAFHCDAIIQVGCWYIIQRVGQTAAKRNILILASLWRFWIWHLTSLHGKVLTASVLGHVLNLGTVSLFLSVYQLLLRLKGTKCNLIKVISCLELTFLYSRWGNSSKRDFNDPRWLC